MSVVTNLTSDDDKEYQITTITGKRWSAGTNAKVYIKLFGSKSDSDVINLRNMNSTDQFERGTLSRVSTTTSNIISKRFAACGFEMSMYENEYISESYSQSYSTTYSSTESSCTSSYSSHRSSSYTSNTSSSSNGYDSSTLHSNSNTFNRVDRFTLKTKDLGIIYQVTVNHDNSGDFPAWYLDRVKVEDLTTSKLYDFGCFQWLQKSRTIDDTSVNLDSGVFPVKSIDQLDAKNRPQHHTADFPDGIFVIRRGQSVFIDVHLARKYNPAADTFHITLQTGKRPRDYDKTQITIPLVDEFDYLSQKWGFKVIDVQDKKISLEINCPSDALVAKYKLFLESDIETVLEHDQPLYIIFNPWCESDDVYMKNEDWRKEYILNEHGAIYVGSSRYISPRKWYFGQFEQVSVDCAFSLLQNTKAKGRDTAIEVSRIISAKVNSNDDDGVLIGNWSGEYDDGRSPTYWTSSPAILDEYMKEKCGVKYGQCWVFSALVTTILRTLGIPTRSITNFNSAHDTDKNASHDVYMDEEGNELDNITGDSIWNFHVWNDSWMARPDLAPGFGGWQAVDATPQERSKGLFQMGPSPLRAIKEGDVDISFDTRFVLAEVNADVIFWQKNKKTEEWEAIKDNNRHVGKHISTKAVGKNEREDITLEYKFAEGSVLERSAVKKALLKAGNVSMKSMPRDLEMKVKPTEKRVDVGKDICMNITITNTGGKDLTVNVAIGGQVVRYNGVAMGKLDRQKHEVVVKAGEAEKIATKILASNYMNHLNEFSLVRYYVSAIAKETEQIMTISKVVEIKKPDITFQSLPTTLYNNKEHEIFVCFKNPLDKELTNCTVHIDGTVMPERFSLKAQNVKPHKEMKLSVKITPAARPGNRSLMATFNSKELNDIQGTAEVDVK